MAGTKLLPGSAVYGEDRPLSVIPEAAVYVSNAAEPAVPIFLGYFEYKLPVVLGNIIGALGDDQPIMMSMKAGIVIASPPRCDAGRYKSLVPNRAVAGNDQNSLF